MSSIEATATALPKSDPNSRGTATLPLDDHHDCRRDREEGCAGGGGANPPLQVLAGSRVV